MRNVFTHQRKLFFKDKGMFLFYLGEILVLGIIVPIFIHNLMTQITLAMFMTVTVQKQWAAESIAGERENKTLESLLSTSIAAKDLLLGKSLFIMICGIFYYGLMISCVLIVRFITKSNNDLSTFGWVIFAITSLCIISITSLYGVLASSKAMNVREAGRKPTIVCYLFSLLFSIVLTIFTMGQSIPIEAVVAISMVFLIIAAMVIIYSLISLFRLKRPSLIEINSPSKIYVKGSNYYAHKGTPSQTLSVFAHEWRYFKTLKGLILHFAISTLCPAIILWIGDYYLGENNLYYAILITIVLIPRIPSNLVAYSVGGEKAYKTGESLLSTPASTKALFIGKSIVPLLICMIMLILSSTFTLIVSNLIAYGNGIKSFMFYSADQIILLYGISLTVNLTMVMASAILSLGAKNPRKGLYFSTILGLVFIVPVLAIIYLMEYKLLGAIAYFVFLLVIDIIIYGKINKMSRPALMARL